MPDNNQKVSVLSAIGTVGTSDLLYIVQGGVPYKTTVAQLMATVLAGNGTAAAPSYSFASETNAGMYRFGATIIGFSIGSAAKLLVSGVGLRIPSDCAFGWDSTTTAGGGSQDTQVTRGAAGVMRFSGTQATNTIQLYDGTNAYTVDVYNAASKYIRVNHDGSHGYVTTNSGGLVLNPSAGVVYFGATDNTFDAGAVGTRIRSGYFGTSMSIGTNPAQAGLVRLSNNVTGITYRNAANNADLEAFSVNASNQLLIGPQGFAGILFNSAATDTDIVFYSDTNGAHFHSDAGLYSGVGAFGFGAAAAAGAYIYIDSPALTNTANNTFGKLVISNSGAITIPTGTASVVASLWVNEPNITATGTVTLATTIYIASAPTEGGTNAALYVASGAVFFNLPTVAGVTGSLWNDSGTVKVA